MPVIGVPAPVAPVRANELSDAVQQQMALDRLIAAQKKQLATIAAQQAALRTQMATTQVNLDQINQNMDEMEGEISSLQVQVDGVQHSYNDLVAQEAELKTELDDLAARADAKQVELTQRQQILADRLVAAYKTDQTPLLSQLLTSGSITDVLSDVSYYMELGAQDQALAAQIREDQANLVLMKQSVETARLSVNQLAAQVSFQKSDLDGQMALLNGARAKIAALQRQINAEMAKQAAADAKLAKNKAALAATIKSNGEASAKLAKKIDQLAAQLGGKGRIPSAYNGALQWPMGGKISQEFGCTGWPGEPRIGNCAHFHQGIDIVAPCLTHASSRRRVRSHRVRRLQPLRRPAEGMARDHRPFHQHGHLVCPHDRQGAGRHLCRRAGVDRPGHRHGEHHRPFLRLPPPLGGARERRVHEPAPLRLAERVAFAGARR
jgi:Uncharacterized protein conserved in bacteria